MKVINLLTLAGSTLIVVASINAWPQTSEPNATSTQSSAPAAQSPRANRQANRALSRRVRSALLKGGVDATNINVIARSGAVTLAGSVVDPSQSEKATEIAKGVPGVTSVKNALGHSVPY